MPEGHAVPPALAVVAVLRCRRPRDSHSRCVLGPSPFELHDRRGQLVRTTALRQADRRVRLRMSMRHCPWSPWPLTLQTTGSPSATLTPMDCSRPRWTARAGHQYRYMPSRSAGGNHQACPASGVAFPASNHGRWAVGFPVIKAGEVSTLACWPGLFTDSDGDALEPTSSERPGRRSSMPAWLAAFDASGPRF